MTKYRAIPTEVDGIRFASKKEARRYSELKLLERAGKISNLHLQPMFRISMNRKNICKVILDFRYWHPESAKTIYEDVKGKDNALSSLKRKLVEAQYGIKVVLT